MGYSATLLSSPPITVSPLSWIRTCIALDEKTPLGATTSADWMEDTYLGADLLGWRFHGVSTNGQARARDVISLHGD